ETLPALRYSSPVLRPDRAADRLHPARDRCRTGEAAAGPHAHPCRLAPNQQRLLEIARPPDRGAAADARHARRLHRLRLPLAETLRPLQSRRPRRTDGGGAALRAGCAVGCASLVVIPAKAGIPLLLPAPEKESEVPAFAGMTS